jgi:hypothetical protein
LSNIRTIRTVNTLRYSLVRVWENQGQRRNEKTWNKYPSTAFSFHNRLYQHEYEQATRGYGRLCFHVQLFPDDKSSTALGMGRGAGTLFTAYRKRAILTITARYHSWAIQSLLMVSLSIYFKSSLKIAEPNSPSLKQGEGVF